MPSGSIDIVAASIMPTMKRLFKMDSITGVASVEFWVLMTTLLLVIRFLLDCFGYADRAMATTIQVIEMINYSMVHYTLGMMQLSAKKVNDYFQVWAVMLVTLQYSVKTGQLYRRSKQILLLDLMSSFWAANLIRMQTFLLLNISLWFIWALNAIRIISYFASSDKAATINQENTRLVSDYMRYEHTLDPSGDGDADNSNSGITMQSYKYLVSGEDLVLHDAQRESKTATAQYKIRLDPHNKKLVTIEKIWNVDDGNNRLLGSTKGSGNRLKDSCLSFALYKLLRRRFYNLPIHEAGQEKTRRLVFDYILQENNNNYERAFRVTAVELSFLQDFFYSKHAALFANGFSVRRMLMSLLLIVATVSLAYPVRYIPERMDQADKNTIAHRVIFTHIILGLIVAKELLEVYQYVFSQWTKVLMICRYIKHRSLRNPAVEAVMGMMFCFIRGKWDQRIFHYNLLVSDSHRRKKSARGIKLESEVKTAIFESFKGLQKHPERLETYFSNAFGSKADLTQQLTWAIELEADTHRILVWHIATCFCEIHISDEVKKLNVLLLPNKLLVNKSTTPEDVWPHYSTAVSLSNYCAYLLTRALVPDNGIVVRRVLKAVRKEIFHATYCSFSQSMQDVYKKLVEIAIEDEAPESSVIYEEDEEDPKGMGEDEIRSSTTNDQVPNMKDSIEGDDNIRNSITQMGAKLGKQLIETYEADRVGLWRDLAVFWSGFLLHLAASTRAAKHKTRLAGKVELITHLWALLSHAGFLGNIRHGQTLLDPEDLNDVNPLR
ncbi:unnamed protein product [Triticum turgidum subsp. durum]|uniref:DUF4220 domain-containing protein n=1 Tax=Triticum turgidum subsp. durum TaxID=4567 RepID=A0A9R0R6X6_TRITD|nr:unnamed protein product [Triticum turgidum subsp. durum]